MYKDMKLIPPIRGIENNPSRDRQDNGIREQSEPRLLRSRYFNIR